MKNVAVALGVAGIAAASAWTQVAVPASSAPVVPLGLDTRAAVSAPAAEGAIRWSRAGLRTIRNHLPGNRADAC